MHFALVAAAFLFLASGGVASAQTPQLAWQPSNGEQLFFDVYRDGSKFGSHVVTFKKIGEDLTVDSDIHLNVSFGPINFFDYIHDVTEHWSSGRLMSVKARTKNDGKWKDLAADAVEAGLRITGVAFKGVVALPVIPSTHWNVAEMMQPAMLSTETGAMLPMSVIDEGLERVKVGEQTLEARHYLVKSEIEASFWYDAAGRWVKCAFTTQGSKINYVLRALPA
jgi:Family of unknown function (DUF6134)